MLLNIFKNLLLIVGIAFLVVLFIAIIQTPFINYKKHKIRKSLNKELNNLTNELIEELKKETEKNEDKKED